MRRGLQMRREENMGVGSKNDVCSVKAVSHGFEVSKQSDTSRKEQL